MKENIFLKSALTEENPFIQTDEVINWLERRNDEVKVNVHRIKFEELAQWYVDPEQGRVRHKSGKFFSIDGISVKTNWGLVNNWKQPIINQPEIGILGILTKEFNGVLYFLMQAKIEPGNINNIQLSPTLQATKSNYTQVHKGRKPLYLEYFVSREKSQVLLDQFQSEQGARFLKKRNRNIIVKVDEEVEVHQDFVWLTLGQIKRLIQHNNLVNMDTRTVISGIPFGNYNDEFLNLYNTILSERNLNSYKNKLLETALTQNKGLYSIDQILNWFTNLKSQYELEVERVPLDSIEEWIIESDEIRHVQKKFFRVIAAKIEIDNREVVSWDQPLIQPVQEGIIAYIIKNINGIYHFLVQAKLECGNFDILEFAPTIQCLTGDYRKSVQTSVPFLDYVLNAPKSQIHFDTFQSEEGGRFYREQNRNMIVEAGEDFPAEIPENYTWMTLNQLKQFLKFNNYLNIQARSLIASLSFI